MNMQNRKQPLHEKLANRFPAWREVFLFLNKNFHLFAALAVVFLTLMAGVGAVAKI